MAYPSGVARFAIELSLADQPGALGAVASLIGSLGGDVVDVDVLEHGRGRARDEITVELADAELAATLGAELASLPGVEVEQLAPVGQYGHHLVVDALEIASAVVAEESADVVLDTLASGVVAAFGVCFAVVLEAERDLPLAAAGDVPPASVSRAGGGLRFVDGEDSLAFPIGEDGLLLVVGRPGWPFRNRERRELTALGRICATRLAQLTR